MTSGAAGASLVIRLLDLRNGQGATRENVNIVCAESRQRYMSREETVEEAKSRVQM